MDPRSKYFPSILKFIFDFNSDRETKGQAKANQKDQKEAKHSDRSKDRPVKPGTRQKRAARAISNEKQHSEEPKYFREDERYRQEMRRGPPRDPRDYYERDHPRGYYDLRDWEYEELRRYQAQRGGSARRGGGMRSGVPFARGGGARGPFEGHRGGRPPFDGRPPYGRPDERPPFDGGRGAERARFERRPGDEQIGRAHV